MTEDLDRLAELPLNEQETRHRLVASAAFQEYWSIVGAEQALLQRGDRGGALRIIDTMSGARADEVRESLGGLMAATRTRILAAQAEATRLETRTWSTVLLALGGAVGLALLATAFITRRMTRSLRLLSAATGAVAAGAFREPIAIESRDEIGALASSLQSNGEPAPSDGRGEAAVLRDRLPRASLAADDRSAEPSTFSISARPSRSPRISSVSPRSSREAPSGCFGLPIRSSR